MSDRLVRALAALAKVCVERDRLERAERRAKLTLVESAKDGGQAA